MNCPTNIKVLYLEDDKIDQMAFERLVREKQLHYDYTIAGSITEATAQLREKHFDIVITDFSIGDGTAFDVFDLVDDTAILFVTGVGDEETAVKAMKRGAYDYLIKDQSRNYLKVLPVTVENAIKHKQAERHNHLLSHAMMSIQDNVYITDRKGTIIFVNEAFCKSYGYAEEEILGAKSSILCDDDSPCQIMHSHSSDDHWLGEMRHIEKNGGTFPVSLSRSVIKDGDDVAIVTVTRDIAERVRAAEKIKKSLQEKNILLKEIHHRVKNNMQVISSMLNLQSEYINDEKYYALFKECQHRVKSMALVHELLYQSKDLAKVDFKEYINNLARILFRSYEACGAVDLQVNVDDIILELDAAIACGLILNELLSNALKHAFPNGRRGTIRVDLRRNNGECVLVVEDNGIGFSKDINFRETTSLGLQLVTSLTEQLEGSIELNSNDGGSEFRITFP